MNSNLNRALASALVAFGSVAPALAQFDWDVHCIDPNNTAPYSADFNAYHLSTDLFGAAIGISGTVTYANGACGNTTAPVIGRIGFTIGPRGSLQDNDPNQSFGGVLDDNMRLTLGTNFIQDFHNAPGLIYPGPGFAPSTGANSFARIYTRDLTTGAVNSYRYGSNGMSLAFIGRSGRYMYTESRVNGTDTNNSINVRCVIDVLGDAARVEWTLTNRLNLNTATSTGTPIGIGLWYSHTVALVTADHVQQVVPVGASPNTFAVTYTTIPGRRPLTVDERFNLTGLDPNGNTQGATVGVPPFVNFSASQAAGFGLQVVNDPSALAQFDAESVIDQTPVDEFVLGDPGFLTPSGNQFGQTDPTNQDFVLNPPGNGNADGAPISADPTFIQKWQPTPVGAGSPRTIVAYYRSTNGDSSYGSTFAGYTAVVDTPKSISTVQGDTGSFSPNPFTIRVNVDNNGGFSIVDQNVSMNNVQVVLSLPAGMHLPGDTGPNGRTIVRNIPRIGPGATGFVDIPVEVDPTTFGALQYSVAITPQPGFLTKTITGTINVATTPRLEIRTGANLVGPPWEFTDNSWESILGLDLNGDFQAYTWDGTTQQYVPQTSAERGRGTFIVSNPDLGFRALGGNPTQPDDQFPDPNNYDIGGAPGVQLHRGWNLVANPYNYAFDIGQLVGVPNGTASAFQYTELVARGYTDGSFTGFDPLRKTYTDPVSGGGGRLQPNGGYWLFANDDFTLIFPPIYDLFIRSAPPAPFVQRFDNWRLKLSAASSGAADLSTYVGVARKPETAAALSFRKAPVSPARNALRAYAVGVAGGNAQLLRSGRGTQAYTYKVYSKQAGPVTVSWPNLREIPSNLAVVLKDAVTGKSVNARSAAGYSYTAAANSERSFTVTVTPQATVSQRVGSVSTTQVKRGSAQGMRISYVLGGRGSATLRVYKGRTLVAVAANDVDAVAGTNVAEWHLIDLNGLPVPAGSYTLEVAAKGEGGDVATRQLAINVRR